MSKVISDGYTPSQSVSDEELKAMFARDAAALSAASSPQATKSIVPTEIIELPSKGFFYPEGHPLANGTIELKYMTAKEEDILSSQSLIKQGVVIDKLLQSLIVTKVKYDDLLTMDKNAVFLAARVLAYGKDYEVEVTCPSCGVKSSHVVDLQQFDTKQIDWSMFTKGQTTHKFVLPVGKQELTLKFLTHGDEKLIEDQLKGAKKLSKITGIDPELTTRLKYLIVAVDGDDNKINISKFVDNMLSRDSLALRTHLKQCTPDIDTTFHFTCPSCGHEQDSMNLPIGISFFWPGV